MHMRSLLSLQRGKLPCCCEQIFELARYRTATSGIPDECATDSGPKFTATATQQFLKEWGVCHRLSSVMFPHSNCRVEAGDKTVKHHPKWKSQHRLPTACHPPVPELLSILTLNSPLFSVSLADRSRISYLSCQAATNLALPGVTLAMREEALRNWHMKAVERWSEHTKWFPSLVVGDHVHL